MGAGPAARAALPHPAPTLPPKLGGQEMRALGRRDRLSAQRSRVGTASGAPHRLGWGTASTDNTVLRPRPAARLPARGKLRRRQRRQSLPPHLPTSSAPAAASALQSQSPPPPRSSRGTAMRGGAVPPPASRRASAWTIWLVQPLPRQGGRRRGGASSGWAGRERGKGRGRPGRGGARGW